MSFDPTILNRILDGSDISGELMAADIPADWEKFDDASFVAAFDRRLAENLVALSESVDASPGLFTITLSARRLPGAEIVVAYDGETPLDAEFREVDSEAVRDALADVETDRDTYVEVSAGGISLVAPTESGDCSVAIERERFRQEIVAAFGNAPRP